MRIAMIGQKGLPATHGGVEHHVQQLGSRLAARGHEVLVYTRPNYSNPSLDTYMGMRLKSVSSVSTKHLDAITHSALSTWDSRSEPLDIVHYHGIGPSIATPLARKRGRRIVATIHGQDWRRAKWNGFATAALRAGEYAALHVPDATISVSRTLAQHYHDTRNRTVSYIPNGVTLAVGDDPGYLAQIGVRPSRYVVFVGRLVPEKGVHYLLDAWNQIGSEMKLVVVGDSSFTDEYATRLQKHASDRVIFTGYLYGAQLATVFRNAGLFVLPSDLEGLPIVLLESLGYGTPVLASDIPPNVEVLGESGEYFPAGNATALANRLQDLLPHMDDLKASALVMRQRILNEYDWERVTDQTEQLYESLLDT